ncbi:MAG TPA: CdaR family protein [Oscillospiraceae bacterium]|nr:CdaR family protein [Oscillospiraceae bacterium]
MTHKKLHLTELFYRDRFVLVFSICAAITLWIVMASTNTQERPIVIDVPITITLSDSAQAQGLKVFDQSSKTAKVSIKGNSVIVHQIKAENLQVVAQLASSINKPCNIPLTLSVQKLGTLTDYEATVDPGSIMVSVDYNKTNTFKIENNLKYKVGDAYFVSDPTFSPDSITISGPESDVSSVAKVSAEYEVSGTLNETKSFNTKLVLYNSYGEKINNDKLKLSASEVKVTIPVLSRKVASLTTHFTNQPTGLSLSNSQVVIDPTTIEVACPQDMLSKLQTIDLEPINFSAITPNRSTFPVNITLPAGCKNLSNIYTANVTLDLSGYTTKTLNVNAKNFSFKNLAANKSAQPITKSFSATVVGPESELSKLTDDSLSAQVDMTDKENFTGPTEMPVTVSISGTSSSWVYGTYKANITVSEK